MTQVPLVLLSVVLILILCTFCIPILVPNSTQHNIGESVPCDSYVTMISSYTRYGQDNQYHTIYTGYDGVSYVTVGSWYEQFTKGSDYPKLLLNRSLRYSDRFCLGNSCSLSGVIHENISVDKTVDNLCKVVP
jgi:hypothetical protein